MQQIIILDSLCVLVYLECITITAGILVYMCGFVCMGQLVVFQRGKHIHGKILHKQQHSFSLFRTLHVSQLYIAVQNRLHAMFVSESICVHFTGKKSYVMT